MLDNDDLEDLTEHWRESPPAHLALRATMVGLGILPASSGTDDGPPQDAGAPPTQAEIERWVASLNVQLGGKLPRV